MTSPKALCEISSLVPRWGLLIWKFLGIMAQIRVLYAENFGLMAHGR